eukprot:g11714.t1
MGEYPGSIEDTESPPDRRATLLFAVSLAAAATAPSALRSSCGEILSGGGRGATPNMLVLEEDVDASPSNFFSMAGDSDTIDPGTRNSSANFTLRGFAAAWLDPSVLSFVFRFRASVPGGTCSRSLLLGELEIADQEEAADDGLIAAPLSSCCATGGTARRLRLRLLAVGAE